MERDFREGFLYERRKARRKLHKTARRSFRGTKLVLQGAGCRA